MTILEKMRESAEETTRLANAVMASPDASEAEFQEAFEARDRAYIESLGLTDEQLGEASWETMCGCNGSDSPYHTYFGL